jgi:hypothetical protein
MGRSYVIHGACNTPAWFAWRAMKTRCRNPNSSAFYLYGARGIKVCDRWLKFAPFLEDMGQPPPGHTLDRIDNNGPYAPENCRWATTLVQQNNTRRSRKIEYQGRTQTVAQWARELGLSRGRVMGRLQSGWSVVDALTRPVDSRFANRGAK